MPVSLLQQLELLVATPVGTVMYDRGFGVDRGMVDQAPPSVVQNLLAAEIADKLEQYIPELQLSAIELVRAPQDGELYLKVVVDYAESL